MSKTILVVDDTASLRRMVTSHLSQEGFRVLTAADGEEALMIARQEHPDLILLGLMMPNMGGYEFIRAYGRNGAPIIILTAKLEENDKVLRLELGADDYVTKPFSRRELTARVRAVLRRGSPEALASDTVRAADIKLDRSSHYVVVGDRNVDLTPSEFDLLATLMSSPGRVFTRLELLERLQGTAYEGYERTIDVHIRNLRRRLRQTCVIHVMLRRSSASATASRPNDKFERAITRHSNTMVHNAEPLAAAVTIDTRSAPTLADAEAHRGLPHRRTCRRTAGCRLCAPPYADGIRSVCQRSRSKLACSDPCQLLPGTQRVGRC